MRARLSTFASVMDAGVRAIDTNVLIRLAVGDDERQTAAAESFIQDGAWVSTLTLAEAIWVLDRVYEKTPGELATTIEMLLNHHSVVLEHPQAVASALTLFRSRPSLGFSDCLMLELARNAGHLPLGTFDRRLGRANGAELLGR